MLPDHLYSAQAANLLPFSSVASDAPVVVCPTSSSPSAPIQQRGTVLHIVNGEHFSGAERVQQLLGRQCPGLGYATHFFCLKRGKFPEHSGLNPSTIEVANMLSRWDLRVVERLVSRIRSSSISLLHAHTPRAALVTAMAAKRTGIPWIYHVHSPTARDSTRGLLNRINGWVERYAVRNCENVITVSKSLRREMLSQGVDRQRLQVVPNGVPAIQPIDTAARMNQYGWRLGLVALMRPRKGVEVALNAMAAIKMHGLPVKLDLIGGFESSAYEQSIHRLIRVLQLSDTVQCTGFTTDVPAALQCLDGLLLPSLFGEGMPMVVLEALSAGLPVVATRVEGTPEVIRHGVEGWLAEPRSAQSLANNIVQLVSDREPWRAMSLRAVQRHRSQFTDLTMASGIARVYNKTLSKQPQA